MKELIEVVAEWANDPVLFVRECLGVTPEPWQIEFLQAMGRIDRVACRSGHGVGKTSCLSWLIFWFGLTREDAKIGVTAPSGPQLDAALWPECAKWQRHMRGVEPLGRMFADQIDIRTGEIRFGDTGNFAVARTARRDQPEALQGLHATNMLFLADEASGIPEIVFEVSQGALSTPGAKVAMTGNPTRPSGFFFEAFHANRDRWYTMRVSSEDVPRARGHIEDIVKTYGKETNAYRVRVLGEFPTNADEQLIALDVVEDAIGRDIDYEPYRTVWGLDVARFGDDRTALAKRRGPVLLEPIVNWRGKDLVETTGRVTQEFMALPRPERPDEILVDVIGVGGGVVDMLRENGLPVRGVNVGEVASSRERFNRLRDELWWKTREWFDGRACSIPNDRDLISELVAPTYTFTSSGKIIVERKDDLKKRGMQSPDLADALCLTFGAAMELREDHARDRYRPRRETRGSWMSV